MKKITLILALLPFFSNLLSQVAFYDAQFISTWSQNNSDKIHILKYKVNNPLFQKSDTVNLLDYLIKRDSIRRGLINRIIGDTINIFNVIDDVRDPFPFDLSDEEHKQLLELRKFVGSPFDSNINLNFESLYKAIAKGKGLIETLSKEGKTTSGFILNSLNLLATIPSLVSGVGNLNAQQQTAIYDGITKYVTQEFKEGATNSYMQLFEKHLDKIGEFQLLFPETYDMIKKRDPFTFPDLGNEWKTPYSKDLQNIPNNLLSYLEYPSICAKCKLLTEKNIKAIKAKEEYKYFKLGVDISDKVIEGYHPVNLLNYLDRTYANDKNYGKVGGIFKILNIIQSNLRDTSKAINGQLDNVWIGFEQLKQLNTPQEWRYFFAIIYQQDRASFQNFFGTPTTISDWEKEIFDKKVLPIYEILLEIQEFARAQNLEKRDFSSFLGLLNKTIRTLNNVSSNDANVSTAIEIIENCTDIFISIKEQNYNTLIQHVSAIIETLLDRTTLNSIEKIELSRFIFALNKFGQFTVSVVNSQNSDELKEVIKQYAAPAESYSKKRNSIWGLAINSHPGFYGSREKLNEDNEEWKTNVGLSLPIGLEIYMGIGKKASDNRYNIFIKNNKEKQLTGTSISLFFHIIDLGAILNYRWTDSESELPNNIDFHDVFSPGIILNIGLKNTPITLGGGYQFAPKLREITSGGNILVPNAHRIQFKVSWDIPFANIINRKPEKANQK